MEYTVYIICLLFCFFTFVFSLAKKLNVAGVSQVIAILLNLLLLIIRSIHAQHPPFTNMYESLILLAFLLQVKFIFFQRVKSTLVSNIQRSIVLLLILVPLILGPETREIHPVMPALNSFWMYIHVPSYMFSYVSLLSATALALVHIFSKKSIFAYEKQMNVDVSLTLIFMSLGMITGSIWGQLSWGNFWSWDPKETWALINLMILSLYYYKKDTITQSWIVLITALSVLFTYFGVTYLLSGLHSYS